MVELDGTDLLFRFPDVHADAACRIDFQRTLRIPDDNREYPLPPGLGSFPMRHVEDHATRLPPSVTERGGVMLPMYQAEALWINFGSTGADYPFAVRIAAGKVNAVTGEPWRDGLERAQQDFLVVPGQPWLDGFSTGKGVVRQFVAMPLGQGYSAEEQVTGEARYGGLQIAVYPMRPERYEEWLKTRQDVRAYMFCEEMSSLVSCNETDPRMGLSPGGLMRQEIYESEFDFDVWDPDISSRCFVHVLNSTQWTEMTGQVMPTEPVTASDYTAAGLPWFDYFDESRAVRAGSPELAKLDSVASLGIKKGEAPLPENDPVQPVEIVPIRRSNAAVSDGRW